MLVRNSALRTSRNEEQKTDYYIAKLYALRSVFNTYSHFLPFDKRSAWKNSYKKCIKWLYKLSDFSEGQADRI